MDDALRARALHAGGDLAAAERHYLRALTVHPGDQGLQYDFAVLLMQSGRNEEAIEKLERCLARVPRHLDTLVALAYAQRAAGRTLDALSTIEQALQQAPGHAAAWLLKGTVLLRDRNHRAAEVALRRCVDLAPRLAEGWHYLGEVLQAQRRWREAAGAYQRALAAQPGEIFNIAMCAEQEGDFLAARNGYMETCRRYPQRADCVMRLAHAEAMLCNFKGEAEAVSRLERLMGAPDRLASDDVPEAFPAIYLSLSHQAHRALLQRYSERVRTIAAGQSRPATPQATDGRLRIGYLSADFGDHAVGHLVADMFAAHDRERFAVYGYSLRTHTDETASRIAAGVDFLRACEAMDSPSIAAMVHSDAIDVLIDLSGYTDGARPEVLALRPARIQLGWLGYLHAQQAPWLDAILLDEHVLPPGAEWPYDDVVAYLPGTLLPARPMKTGTPDRPRFGLPADAPVLATFNNSYKIDNALVAAWCEILRRAPEAHLLVYLPPFAWDGFMHGWHQHNGDATRLHRATKLDTASHADRAASCDLLLDAFRYQGGATAVEAVSCGLPILTREGTSPPSRLGVSLNRYLGMNELVCADTESYIAKGAELANQPHRLAAVRRRLSDNIAMSELFDPRRSAAAIEQIALKYVNCGHSA